MVREARSPLDLGIFLGTALAPTYQWIVFQGEYLGEPCLAYEFAPNPFRMTTLKAAKAQAATPNALPADDPHDRYARYLAATELLPSVRAVATAMDTAPSQLSRVLGGGMSQKTGSFWLAFEFPLSGAAIPAGVMDVDQVCKLGASLGRAMHALHAQKLLHLDINPSTILLVDETVRLTGFGIDLRALVRPGTEQQALARHGVAPPELFDRSGVSPVGPWTDIYLASSTLYELLTGEQPPDFRQRLDKADHGLADIARALEAAAQGKAAPAMIQAIASGLAPAVGNRPADALEWAQSFWDDNASGAELEQGGRLELDPPKAAPETEAAEQSTPSSAALAVTMFGLGCVPGAGAAWAGFAMLDDWASRTASIFAMGACVALWISVLRSEVSKSLAAGFSAACFGGSVGLIATSHLIGTGPDGPIDWLISATALASIPLALQRKLAPVLCLAAISGALWASLFYPDGAQRRMAAATAKPQVPRVEKADVRPGGTRPPASGPDNFVSFATGAAIDVTPMLGSFRIDSDPDCEEPLRIAAVRRDKRIANLSMQRPGGAIWTLDWADVVSVRPIDAERRAKLSSAQSVSAEVEVQSVRRADGTIPDSEGLIGRKFRLAYAASSKTLTVELKFGPDRDDVERETFIKCQTIS